jgi:hypothetical protein
VGYDCNYVSFFRPAVSRLLINILASHNLALNLSIQASVALAHICRLFGAPCDDLALEVAPLFDNNQGLSHWGALIPLGSTLELADLVLERTDDHLDLLRGPLRNKCRLPSWRIREGS